MQGRAHITQRPEPSSRTRSRTHKSAARRAHQSGHTTGAAFAMAAKSGRPTTRQMRRIFLTLTPAGTSDSRKFLETWGAVLVHVACNRSLLGTT
eukprot:3004570-Prymnesium_polylepis.1